jgi:pimeloyl-ACP methyl ester carboxylesterase
MQPPVLRVPADGDGERGMAEIERLERQLTVEPGVTVSVDSVCVGNPGPVELVWVHGLGAASTITFADLVLHPDLQGVRSHLIDLPGYGHSGAPDDWAYTIEAYAECVNQVIETLDAPLIVLFGHSMGGSVALSAAMNASRALCGLIVAEPNLDPGIGNVSAHIAAQREDAFIQRGYGALVRSVRAGAVRDPSRSTWPETLAMASPTALYRSAASLIAARDPTFREMLENPRVPVVLLRGEMGSEMGAPIAHPWLSEAVIAGGGHELWVDNQDEVASVIAGVVREVAKSRPSRWR